MIRNIITGITIWFTLINLTWAYEIETHEDMSQKSTEISVIFKDIGVLTGIGLEPIENKQKFPNSNGSNKDIVDLFRDGAKFEDNFPRFLNHFYDPIQNRPLQNVSPYSPETSPDWAIEDMEEFGTQDFSYRDVLDYFYEALTIPKGFLKQADEKTRKENFGLTFQTLGHVIHHIQDMAQPQHVRLDEHCSSKYICGLLGRLNPSLYEGHTDLKEVREQLPFDGYSPVVVNFPRELWHTTEDDLMMRKGIADYTNRGFVSAGTGPTNSDFPQPVLGGEWQIDVRDLFSQASPAIGVPPQCNDNAAPCFMTFLTNTVIDSYDDNFTRFNDRAASNSIFDQDLEIHGAAVTYMTAGGQAYATPQIYALNQFNIERAHEFLIPRAVGYSAGLIDYFFRGRIDVTHAHEEMDLNLQLPVYRITVRNVSSTGNTFSDGAFELFYDDLYGIRQRMTILGGNGGLVDTVGLAVGEEMELVVAVPFDRALRHDMTVVFRGDIGVLEGVAGRVFDTEPDVFVLDVVGSDVYQFSATGVSKGGARTADSNIGLSVYANALYTATGQYSNDTSVSDTGVYRSFADSSEAWATVPNAQGGSTQVTVSPGYYWQGGEIRIAANNTHFATTNNSELYIYTSDGTQVGKVSEIDINNPEVAITKDRVYIVDAGIVKIYSLTGNPEGIVSSVPYWWFASLAVTERHLYISETKWNGCCVPRTNWLHIYDRDVTRNELGEIIADSYLFSETINFSAISNQPRSASVDREGMMLD